MTPVSRQDTPTNSENYAGVVQRLVCEFSKLEIGVRFPAPAPKNGARALVAQLDRAEDF
jgi:hypothetical protein